ncbi:exocyst complex component EXO70B2-like [Miscanthus floridulus]|uniref:exocyst complex component EXO70B2-like n=1 Tax=Miscanthus floridulus TaxID=154761 RepID=UPI00345AF9C4
MGSVRNRDEDDSAYMIGTYDLPSFGSFHHLSSGSTYTSSILSSFFRDSCSTGSGLDITRLDDTALENTASVFDDTRFSDIFGHVSIGAFKEVAASHPNLADQSQELHQAFHTKCIEVLTRCRFAGGTDSVLGVDCKGLEGEQWRIIKSWPAALEYIVRVLNAALMQPKQNRTAKVLNTLQLQLLKQNRRACTLYDAFPTLSRVFGEEFVKKETEGVFAALKDSSLEIIRELKVLVQTYSPKKVPMEGSILTITGYLMKYIRLLVNHIGSLDMILCRSQANGPLTIEGVNMTGRLATGLIADLESVLKEKSSIYASEPGLQSLFLMNNAHFILQEVEESDVRLMVGAEWIKKRCYHIKQYKTDYLSSSWKQVVHHLETATSTSPPKRRMNNFLKIFYSTPSPLKSFESALNKTWKS